MIRCLFWCFSWSLKAHNPVHGPLNSPCSYHCYLFSSRLTQCVRVVFIRNLENPIRWLSNHITQGHLPVSVSGESINLSVQLLSFTSSLTQEDFLRLHVWFSSLTQEPHHLIWALSHAFWFHLPLSNVTASFFKGVVYHIVSYCYMNHNSF